MEKEILHDMEFLIYLMKISQYDIDIQDDLSQAD